MLVNSASSDDLPQAIKFPDVTKCPYSHNGTHRLGRLGLDHILRYLVINDEAYKQ